MAAYFRRRGIDPEKLARILESSPVVESDLQTV
jgi:hypothetical protein